MGKDMNNSFCVTLGNQKTIKRLLEVYVDIYKCKVSNLNSPEEAEALGDDDNNSVAAAGKFNSQIKHTVGFLEESYTGLITTKIKYSTVVCGDEIIYTAFIHIYAIDKLDEDKL